LHGYCTANVPHALPISFASDLGVCTPAGIEQFFDTIGWDPSQSKPEGWTPPPSPETIPAVMAESGQRILGPPNEPLRVMSIQRYGKAPKAIRHGGTCLTETRSQRIREGFCDQ
jgi:hypothetical protein